MEYDNATDFEKKLITLHKYFIWCDRMRVHFYSIRNQSIDGKVVDEKIHRIDSVLYMSLWYGLLYVIVEGWKELKLNDQEIDKLLQSPNTDLLKRYRNGVFHFQTDYNDERFENFFKETTTVVWVRKLNEEFSRFFLNYFKEKD